MKFNKKVAQNRINSDLRYEKQIRIIGENVENKVYDVDDAIKIAEDMGLDLVEINRTSNPVVCKIIEYSKYLYDKKIKEKEKKKNQVIADVKELRFGPNTSEHDYQFKLKHATNFLTRGDIVKAVVIFHGREVNYVEMGELILNRLADDLKDISIIESNSKLDRKRLTIVLKPKK